MIHYAGTSSGRFAVDKEWPFLCCRPVPLLHPEAQTVQEMPRVGAISSCRNLADDTIEQRIRLVERFWRTPMSFRGRGHRRWLRNSSATALDRAVSETIRGYQRVALFCSYSVSRLAGTGCEQRFGAHPARVFEWNTAAHVQDGEQSPAKRASPNASWEFSDTPTTGSPSPLRAQGVVRPTATQ